MTGYPWASGDALLAADLNDAIANNISGPFLPLSGGTLTGTLFSKINVAWSGGWSGFNGAPGNNTPVGLQLHTQYTGAPTSSYHDPNGGQQIPVNYILLTDQLDYDPPASYVNALMVRHEFGGGATSGGRVAVLIDLHSIGPFTTSGNDFYSCMQFSTLAGNNETGSTAAAPKGNYYGWNMYTTARKTGVDGQPIYLQGLGGFEIDYTIEDGASVYSGAGINLFNTSPPNNMETHDGTGINIAAMNDNTAGNVGWKDNALYFGAHRPGGHNLPVQAGASLIGADAGTVVNGIDFSLTTFTGAFLKGPGGFRVDGNNTVHSDIIQAATASTAVSIRNSNGNPLWSFAWYGTPVNYIGSLSAPAGAYPILAATSTVDADSFLELRGGGTSGVAGGVAISSGTAARIAMFQGVASAVSFLFVLSSAAGANVRVDTAGTATGVTVGGTNATNVTVGKGTVILPTLPTSAAGLVTGQVWRNGNVLNIV